MNNTKYQQSVQAIINTLEFKPVHYGEGLYLSKKAGAVMYCSGGILEIDFGHVDGIVSSKRRYFVYQFLGKLARLGQRFFPNNN